MTLVASILFLSALAISVFAIAATIGDSMPRIIEVVEDAMGPQMRKERVVTTAAPRIHVASMPRPVSASDFRRAPAFKRQPSPQPARLAA